MCGICGIALRDSSATAERATVEAMMNSIGHRGPDDSGVFLSGPVALGHRRLSIVDLGGGHQPMQNEDGTVTIVYNGEVYNHAEYRQPLEARGHRFRSRSDTEAIIHLYEEHGAEAPALLRGMFAFAIWNERTRSLFIARDHTGIKPFYYYLSPEGDLVFGSEIKAILASGMVEPAVDESRLSEYFALGSLSGASTLYRGIRKLEPGCSLEWRDGRTTIRRYWALPSWDADAASRSVQTLDAAAAEFWRRFVEAVHVTLMSDVPLGVFLSGGIDSSLIVAAMRAGGVEELRTFSVGFAEAEASELPYARVVARHFRTDHHEVICSADQFFDALPQLTWHRDQPLTFSASIPLFFVSELARDSVKVVLTGEGSDEFFAGYGRYPRGLLNLRLARALDGVMPNGARRALAGVARRAGDTRFGNRLKRSFLARPASFVNSYLESFADFDQEHRSRLLGPERALHAYDAVAKLVDDELLGVNPLESMLRFDTATYLEELLAKQDQMSMAASIESRVPFLDPRLLEWAATLPPSVKLTGFTGKALVRQAARQHLPTEITTARKRGFLVPLARWLRERSGQLLDTYGPEPGDALLDAAYVEQLVREHAAGHDHTARLWRIFAFQAWRQLPQRVAPSAAQYGAPLSLA